MQNKTDSSIIIFTVKRKKSCSATTTAVMVQSSFFVIAIPGHYSELYAPEEKNGSVEPQSVLH